MGTYIVPHSTYLSHFYIIIQKRNISGMENVAMLENIYILTYENYTKKWTLFCLQWDANPLWYFHIQTVLEFQNLPQLPIGYNSVLLVHQTQQYLYI